MLGNELDAPLQPRKSRNSDAALQASQGRESLPGPSSFTAHRDENQDNSSRRKSRDSGFGLGGDESGMIETPSGPAMGRRSLNSKEDRTRESQQIPSRDSRDQQDVTPSAPPMSSSFSTPSNNSDLFHSTLASLRETNDVLLRKIKTERGTSEIIREDVKELEAILGRLEGLAMGLKK